MLRRVLLLVSLLFLMVNMVPSINQNQPNRTRTIKQIVPVDKATAPFFAIQILALKDAPRDASFFENIESAREFSCTDGYKRYVVGRYATEAEAAAALGSIRSKGPRYAKAYVVNTANYSISGASFKSEFTQEVGLDNIQNTDKKALVDQVRTTKKIIPVDKATEPPFSIQIIALKNPPQDANFFENVDAAREFSCSDGFTRYVVGQYATQQDASADLTRIRSLSPKYKNAFVVNTFNFDIQSSAFTKEFIIDKTSSSTEIKTSRTSKRIVPVDKLNQDNFTIQVLALKDIPRDAAFFERLDEVKEVSCVDGFKRYLVGDYTKAEDARRDCEAIRKIGPKYQNAFIISNQKIKLDATVFRAEYKDKLPTQSGPVKSLPAEKQTVVNQSVLDANNEVKQSGNLAYQENVSIKSDNSIDVQAKPIEPIKEEKITRIKEDEYRVELPTRNVAETKPISSPTVIQTSSGQTAVRVDNKIIVDSKKTLSTTSEEPLKKEDKTSAILTNDEPYVLDENKPTRTSKKIVPVDKAVKPFYTIQVLALKDTPTDPLFFDNIESAREFSCKDGYKRYVVGKYDTYEEAKADIERVKTLSPKYKNAFVANTKNYDISLNDFRRDFSENVIEDETAVLTEQDDNPKFSVLNKIEKTSALAVVKQYDLTTIYTIQLTASRYPFYVSELKEFKDVYEFFMPDKVYRYTVGKYKGSEVEAEIKKVVGYGYAEAFAVEWNKYLPYKIE